MWEWFAEYQNISGIFQEVQPLTHSPIYIGLFAEVPSTWNIAGRIYFVDSLGSERLLLGTSQIYFNMVHWGAGPPTGYNIIFVPVRYLKIYTIKLGKEFAQ
jgi:hypothetical protein